MAKKPEVSYSQVFDAAMSERFPEHSFSTYWNSFIGSFGNYHTILDGDPNKTLTPEMVLFGSGFSAGFTSRGAA